ncbi:hypothetical protein [Aureispira anguillae]|uniref:Uncharacterized protein n=1 Tax=Aureispira anguillae TaxID=2864201 RepID=A0A916DQF3_9BACT|nr:hypothetical protein [Aureispira anguillae]BDS10060.1 hypothetical protein AsAng_0007650 [Aureispira anguillae]
MQKLILLLLLFAPFGLLAQSNAEARLAHQQAENQLVGRYPLAKKMDIEALTIQQKDQHKTCNTCSKKQQKTQHSIAVSSHTQDLAHLKANQQKLTAVVKDLQEAQNSDAVLLAKYQKAIELNQRQIAVAERQLSNQQQLDAKKSE